MINSLVILEEERSDDEESGVGEYFPAPQMLQPACGGLPA